MPQLRVLRLRRITLPLRLRLFCLLLLLLRRCLLLLLLLLLLLRLLLRSNRLNLLRL